MPNRDLIVIGASAGGIEALQEICSKLPARLNAAVLVVMHTSSHAGSFLPRVLDRAGSLPATHARDRETLRKGHIYVAPPDCHMLVEDAHLRVVKGPRENRHRPAIDPTFRSAALSYGPRVIGVILTGLLDDGTSGLMVIRAARGAALIQDPATAMFASMPLSALQRVRDARVVPLQDMAGALIELVNEEVTVAKRPTNGGAVKEVRLAEFDMAEIENEMRNGKPSPFACPECGGVLWEIDQEGLLRFRCRVGHAYTAQNLRAEQRQAIETALWSGLRALEESASLYRRMAGRAHKASQDKTQAIYEERASSAELNSQNLRNFLVALTSPETEEMAENGL